jgi:hypothetical protein
MAIASESTSFTKDIQGRYLCNTYGEATAGGPFDIVVIGGGTFGSAIAEHVWFRQKQAGVHASGACAEHRHPRPVRSGRCRDPE